MPVFKYVGPDGSHYNGLVVVDGVKGRGALLKNGESYDLRFERDETDPPDAKPVTDPGPDWERVKDAPAAKAPDAPAVTPAP